MNQNSPVAETAPLPPPAPFSESIPRSRSRPPSLHTAPPRASPSQTRDGWASAQNPSGSLRPAPAPAPGIPHPSRTACRHSKTSRPLQSFSRSRHPACSRRRCKQSEISALPPPSRPPSDALAPRQSQASAPRSSQFPPGFLQTVRAGCSPDSAAPPSSPRPHTNKPDSDTASRFPPPPAAHSPRTLQPSPPQSAPTLPYP